MTLRIGQKWPIQWAAPATNASYSLAFPWLRTLVSLDLDRLGSAVRRLTAAPFLTSHEISDGELTMLSGSKRDGLIEAFWAFAGIAGGLLSPVVQSYLKSYTGEESERTQLEFINLLEMLGFGASFVLAIALLIIWNQRGKSQTSLEKEIRARKASNQ